MTLRPRWDDRTIDASIRFRNWTRGCIDELESRLDDCEVMSDCYDYIQDEMDILQDRLDAMQELDDMYDDIPLYNDYDDIDRDDDW